jgi:phosphomannomutase
VVDVNQVDGLRATLASGEIVHLRPSGNAPELRCYAEADTAERAAELSRWGLAKAAERTRG